MDATDEAAALRARLKQIEGQRLTRAETRAIVRWQREATETAIAEYLAAVPKSVYCSMAGRQNKSVDEFGERYQIPCTGPAIDLFAVVAALHTRIIDYAAAARPALDGDENDLVREKLRQEIGKLQRQSAALQITLDQSQQRLLAKSEVNAGLEWLAGKLQALSARVHRFGGEPAVDAVNDFLTELASEIESGALHF